MDDYKNDNDNDSTKEKKKKKKGRSKIKKLLKRASFDLQELRDGSCGRMFTGLTCLEDWQMIQQHHTTTTNDKSSTKHFESHLVLKQESSNYGNLVADMRDHRDIMLRWLMCKISDASMERTTKKRKKSVEEEIQSIISRKLPSSWLHCIHNPVCITNFCVVFVQLDHLSLDEDEIRDLVMDHVKFTPIDDTEKQKKGRRRKGMLIQTHFYDDTYENVTPLCASEEFLYLKQKPKKPQEEGNDDIAVSKGSCSQSTQLLPCINSSSLWDQLYELKLTKDQLKEEGYPLVVEVEEDHINTGKQCERESKKDNEASVYERIRSTRYDYVLHSDDKGNCTYFSNEDVVTMVSEVAENSIENNWWVEEGQIKDGNDESSNYFVSTTSIDDTNDVSNRNIYSLDCEMVRTQVGNELGRVSLIRHKPTKDNPDDFEVIIDSVVKPRGRILDYVTEFSGLTAKDMNGVSTTLEQIQLAFVSTLDERDILIGHSLENDLSCLRIIHYNVVDTALLFGEQNGRKHALRHITAALLKWKIQQNDGRGHCSIEDAKAALTLSLRRCRIGSSFRYIPKSSRMKRNIIEILEKLAKGLVSEHVQPTFNLTAAQSATPSFYYVGPSDWINQHISSRTSAHALTCNSIMDDRINCVLGLMQVKKKPKVIVSQLCDTKNTSVEHIKNVLVKLFNALPQQTGLIISFQTGLLEAQEISKMKKSRSDPRSSLPWTQTDEDKLQGVVSKAAMGPVLWVT